MTSVSWRRTALAAAVAFLWTAASVPATAAPPGPTTRPAERAAEAAPAEGAAAAETDFREQLAGDADNLVVIGDPLPHLRALLHHERLRAALQDGRLAAALRRMDPAMPPLDPATLWAQIEPNERYVPREIAAGFPDESVEAFDRLVRSGILFGLIGGAQESGDEAAMEDLPELRARLLEELKALQTPRYVVWVRLREAQDAAQIIGMVQMQAGMVVGMMGEGLELEAGDNSVTIRLSVADAMDAGTLTMMLEEAGAVESADDAAAREMAEALRKIELQLTLEQRGDGLRFTIGEPRDGEPPLDADRLGPLYREEPSTIAFARWHGEPIKEAVRGWVELWERWSDTPAGLAVLEADTADMVGSLELAAAQIEAMGDRGAARLWADDALRAHLRLEGVEPAPPLAESSIVELAPASSEGHFLTTDRSLADVLSQTLLQFEDRLARQQMQAEWGGGDEAEMIETVAENYYEHFSRFRELVLEDAPGLFEPGVGTFYATQGKVARFAASGEEDGEVQRFEVTDVPSMEVALVAKADDAAAARAFVEEAYTSAIESTFRALERGRGADAPPLVSEEDLGLGVPTWVFDGSWITPLSGPAKVTIEAEGDLRPHVFTAGDHVVISSSPRLSREIIGAQKDPAARLKLPAGEDGTLITHYLLPGDTMGAFFEQAAAWMRRMPEMELDAAGDGPRSLEELAELFSGIGEFVGVIDRFEWRVGQQDDRRDGRMEVTLTEE